MDTVLQTFKPRRLRFGSEEKIGLVIFSRSLPVVPTKDAEGNGEFVLPLMDLTQNLEANFHELDSRKTNSGSTSTGCRATRWCLS